MSYRLVEAIFMLRRWFLSKGSEMPEITITFKTREHKHEIVRDLQLETNSYEWPSGTPPDYSRPFSMCGIQVTLKSKEDGP